MRSIHFIVLFVSSISFAQNTPFLDDQRKKMGEEEAKKSFIEEKKQELGTDEQTSFIEDQKKKIAPVESTKGYTENEKAKLPLKEKISTISEVKAGRSELRVDRREPIDSAFGFSVGASVDRSYRSKKTSRNLSNVYGSGWDPDFQFFYENQFSRNERGVAFGIAGQFGISVSSTDSPAFAVPITKPDGTIATSADTKLSFMTLPVSIGPVMRINFLKHFRPYAKIGGNWFPYSEYSKDIGRRYGYSYGYSYSAGLNIGLDWMSGGSSSFLYQEFSIQRMYLTLDYTGIETLGGNLEVSQKGFYAGFTFEK